MLDVAKEFCDITPCDSLVVPCALVVPWALVVPRALVTPCALLPPPSPRLIQDKLPLPRRQPPGLVRKVADAEKGGNGHRHGQDALEDKDPAPVAQPPDAVHARNGRGQQAAKGRGDDDGAKVDGEALLGLLAPVPEADEVEAAGEDAGLEDAQQEARGEQAAVVADEALAQHDDAEAQDAERQPHARRHALQRQVGRDLQQDVGHEEDGQRRVWLLAAQAQVSRHAHGEGIGYVCAARHVRLPWMRECDDDGNLPVEKRHDVDEEEHGQQADVGPAEEAGGLGV